MCVAHYTRWLRHGDPEGGRKFSQDGRYTMTNGYIQMKAPGHPNANAGGYILEHRFVMSEHMARPLLPAETVHHKNGDRQDNRLENLELWADSHQRGQRVEDLVEHAVQILEVYAPERLA